MHVQSFDTQIIGKIVELQVLIENFLKPDQKFASFEKDMEAIHASIRDIKEEKDRLLKKFNLLKDHLTL